MMLLFIASGVVAQVPFDQAMADLASADAATRLRTAQMLKEAAYPESAIPLAKAVVDRDDAVQLEAIAAELNIFLAEKIVPRKRVGFLIEKRTPVAADAIFMSGPLAVGPRPVPSEVLDALLTAARDDNPRVRLEAVYAFGVLAVESRGDRRRQLLRTGGRDVAAMIGAIDPSHRYAAIRVIGRVFEHRPDDDPIDPYVGDAVIVALNEKEKAMQAAAMQALGAMRYERAVQGLIDLFQFYRGKGDMAESALDAIAHIAHSSSVPLLLAQLGSNNDTLRGLAAEGLGRAGDRARLNDVQTALATERNPSVQLAGSFAAAMLSEAGTEGLARLVEALQNPRLREQARWYLIEAAPGRTQAFTRYLQDPDPLVRTVLVDALGLSDDTAALALVQPMASDPDLQVARAVERALARLRQISR